MDYKNYANAMHLTNQRKRPTIGEYTNYNNFHLRTDWITIVIHNEANAHAKLNNYKVTYEY